MSEFADAETMLIAPIREHTDIPVVATKVRNPRPPRYARIWRTGGRSINRVLERPQITITCGAAPAEGENGAMIAKRDIQAIRHMLLHKAGDWFPLIRGPVEIGSFYFDPDPDTGEDRYSMTVHFNARAAR